MHANGHREQAVGNLCAGNSDRGFYGTISFSDSYLDNKTHKVRAYFVRENGTNFELQGSFKNVFFDSPNPVIVNSTAIESYAVPGGPPPQTPPTYFALGLCDKLQSSELHIYSRQYSIGRANKRPA